MIENLLSGMNLCAGAIVQSAEIPLVPGEGQWDLVASSVCAGPWQPLVCSGGLWYDSMLVRSGFQKLLCLCFLLLYQILSM